MLYLMITATVPPHPPTPASTGDELQHRGITIKKPQSSRFPELACRLSELILGGITPEFTRKQQRFAEARHFRILEVKSSQNAEPPDQGIDFLGFHSLSLINISVTHFSLDCFSSRQGKVNTSLHQLVGIMVDYLYTLKTALQILPEWQDR